MIEGISFTSEYPLLMASIVMELPPKIEPPRALRAHRCDPTPFLQPPHLEKSGVKCSLLSHFDDRLKTHRVSNCLTNYAA